MNEITPQSQKEKALVDKVLRRWDAASAERGQWMALWDELAAYFRPSRDDVFTRSQTPRDQAMLFDGTGISANMVLASGCMSRLTPAQVPWFEFAPPRPLKDIDRVKRWYLECTEIAIEALATSNFYTELHECYLDRGAFGTSLLHVEGSMRHPLIFAACDIGKYAVLNGADRRVDTIFRELQLTAREAAQLYPVELLPKCIQDELKNGKSTGVKHGFLHVIYPREDSERDGNKMDGENKPIASLHIYLKDRKLIRNSGYDEMPSIASRYLRWGESSYGIPPSWMALADARQVNQLQMNMDVLAGLAANPRVLIPYDMEGEVDLREGGVTYFKDEQNLPREWATSGRYDIGLERVRQRQQAIRDFFHVDLFQMWQAVTKQMTAMEVSARENEKIELFSPTFTLLTAELYGPLLRRVFSLLLRQGVFPEPPPEAVYINAAGRYAIPDPDIRYTSRLALALKAVHSSGLQRTLGQFAPLLQQFPQLLDNINMDRAFREIAQNEGVPVDWMPPEDEIAMLRDQRAQAAAQQEQMQQAMVGADVAQKLSKTGLIPGLERSRA